MATLTDLSLHVHDDHCVGAVAHDKVLRVLGQQDDIIDCDISAGWRSQRLEGAGALSGLHVPDLKHVEDEWESKKHYEKEVDEWGYF